eukprot:Sspe_Gene.36866::Locus_17811_Transcript_1_1_Confidence_1.000_Length_1905::g.36866::m.36866
MAGLVQRKTDSSIHYFPKELENEQNKRAVSYNGFDDEDVPQEGQEVHDSDDDASSYTDSESAVKAPLADGTARQQPSEEKPDETPTTQAVVPPEPTPAAVDENGRSQSRPSTPVKQQPPRVSSAPSEDTGKVQQGSPALPKPPRKQASAPRPPPKSKDAWGDAKKVKKGSAEGRPEKVQDINRLRRLNQELEEQIVQMQQVLATMKDRTRKGSNGNKKHDDAKFCDAIAKQTEWYIRENEQLLQRLNSQVDADRVLELRTQLQEKDAEVKQLQNDLRKLTKELEDTGKALTTETSLEEELDRLSRGHKKEVNGLRERIAAAHEAYQRDEDTLQAQTRKLEELQEKISTEGIPPINVALIKETQQAIDDREKRCAALRHQHSVVQKAHSTDKVRLRRGVKELREQISNLTHTLEGLDEALKERQVAISKNMRVNNEARKHAPKPRSLQPMPRTSPKSEALSAEGRKEKEKGKTGSLEETCWMCNAVECVCPSASSTTTRKSRKSPGMSPMTSPRSLTSDPEKIEGGDEEAARSPESNGDGSELEELTRINASDGESGELPE